MFQYIFYAGFGIQLDKINFLNGNKNIVEFQIFYRSHSAKKGRVHNFRCKFRHSLQK